MTRAKAAEVAEALKIPEDAVLDLPSESGGVDLETKTPEKDERTPLSEIVPNSGGSKEEEAQGSEELKKSTRGRKAGKKGPKGRKDLATSTTSQPETLDELPGVVPDEKETLSSPASEAAAEGLMNEIPESE